MSLPPRRTDLAYHLERARLEMRLVMRELMRCLDMSSQDEAHSMSAPADEAPGRAGRAGRVMAVGGRVRASTPVTDTAVTRRCSGTTQEPEEGSRCTRYSEPCMKATLTCEEKV